MVAFFDVVDVNGGAASLRSEDVGGRVGEAIWICAGFFEGRYELIVWFVSLDEDAGVFEEGIVGGGCGGRCRR